MRHDPQHFFSAHSAVLRLHVVRLSVCDVGGSGPHRFKFGRYIHRVHPYKSPLKILGTKGAWAYPGTAEIFSVPPIISGTGKATNFKFSTHILNIDRNKSPLQILGKVAVGVVRSQDSRNFSEHPYIGRIARSSLR